MLVCRQCCLIFAIGAVALLAVDRLVAEETALTPATVRMLEEKVKRPFAAANMPALLDGIGDVVAASSPELIEQFDELLVAEGYARLETMATRVWIRHIEQRTTSKLPRLKWQLAALVIPAMHEHVEQTLIEQSRHPLMKRPISAPSDFEIYEKSLWDLHVFDKQLINALIVAESAEKLGKPFERKFEKLNGNTTDSTPDFQKLANRIREQQQTLAEQTAEMRYYRLEDAASKLASTSDFETRLRAAFALEFDAIAFEAFLKNHPNPKREILKGDSFREGVRDLVEEGRRDGKDVLHKAKLLHIAMHWWIRGRYGAGPMRGGLLKSPDALLSAANQFPLYMPAQPYATNPADNQSQQSQKAPQYDRRHHYIWAAEDSQIQDRTATFTTAKFFH